MTGKHELPLETQVALALEDKLSPEDRIEASFRVKDVLSAANAMGGTEQVYSAVNGLRVRVEDEQEKLRIRG